MTSSDLVAPTHAAARPVCSRPSPRDTLHHGDLSFGIYYQDYDLERGTALGFAPLIGARLHDDMGYDLYRAQRLARLRPDRPLGSLARWLPWDRLSRTMAATASASSTAISTRASSPTAAWATSAWPRSSASTRPTAPSRFALSLFADLADRRQEQRHRHRQRRISASVCTAPHGQFTLGRDVRDRRRPQRRATRTSRRSAPIVELPNELAPRRRSEHPARLVAHHELDHRSQRPLLQRRRLSSRNRRSSS